MKHYRALVPVVMIFLMAISVYYYFNNISSENKEYQGYITQGDNYYEEQLYVKAVAAYAKAQAMKDSVDVDKKVADCFEAQGLVSDTQRLYENMLENYPKNVKAYEYVMEYYLKNNKYAAIYSANAAMQKRGLASEKITDILKQIQYAYYLDESMAVNVGEYFNGYCIVESKTGEKGLVSENGGLALGGIKYKTVTDFYTDCSAVTNAEDEVYFVDASGNRTMNYKGEEAAQELGLFTTDRYWAKIGDVYAYYNEKGEKLSDNYQRAVNFNGDFAMVQQNDRWTLVNSKFEQIGDKEYANIIIDDNGYAIRKGLLFANYEGKGYQLTNTDGETVSEEYYEDARLMIDGTYAAVQKDGKWGFIDAEGKVVIEPQYDDARSFSNGYAAVQKDGKWGFINSDNEMVIEPEFEDARGFNSFMRSFVKKEEKWYLLCLYSNNY